MSDTWTTKLSEYLDGELRPEEQDLLEGHLERCDECARTLAELRRVVMRAEALDDSPPRADLWSGIAARIGASVRTPPQRRRARRLRAVWGRRISVPVPQLLAAGAAAIMVSGGAVWLATRGGAPESSVAVVREEPSTPALLVTTGDVRFDDAVTDLVGVLEGAREYLDPATVRIVEENLATIDRAIRRAQEALVQDPNSEYLRSHLEETMQRKLSLLRQVTGLAGSI